MVKKMFSSSFIELIKKLQTSMPTVLIMYSKMLICHLQNVFDAFFITLLEI